MIHKVTFLVLFFLSLGIPVFVDLTNAWTVERRDENRTFKDEINFDLSHLDPFPSEFDQYFKDNFCLRAPFLEIFFELRFSLFEIPPKPEQHYIGKDDWFFLKIRKSPIYEGKNPLEEDQLKKLKTEWISRKAYFDSLGIPIHWLIVPLKHYVYEEMLPNYIQKGEGPMRATMVEEYFEPEINGLIYNPYSDLVEAKKVRKTYYKLDIHWNDWGAYNASRSMLNHLRGIYGESKIKHPTEFTWTDSSFHSGYHWDLIGIDRVHEIDFKANTELAKAKKVKKYGYPIPYDYFYKEGYEWRFLNKADSTGLRALIIRDSFADTMAKFFAEGFKESLFIFDGWQYKRNQKIVETYKPDIVIFLTAEDKLEQHIHWIGKE